MVTPRETCQAVTVAGRRDDARRSPTCTKPATQVVNGITLCTRHANMARSGRKVVTR